MNKIKVLLAAVLLAVGLASVTASPVQAKGDNSGVTHNANDPGYNEPIKVQCVDFTYRWLGLGVSSGSAGKCPNGGNVRSIIPAPGEVIKCHDQWGNYYEWGYGNNPSIGSNIYFNCTNSLA